MSDRLCAVKPWSFQDKPQWLFWIDSVEWGPQCRAYYLYARKRGLWHWARSLSWDGVEIPAHRNIEMVPLHTFSVRSLAAVRDLICEADRHIHLSKFNEKASEQVRLTVEYLHGMIDMSAETPEREAT